MPILDEFIRLPLEAITITRDSRQRREIITDSLERSISKLGVLQPIIVDRQHQLIAGERRLEASRRLGLPDIPVRYADQLSPIESKIMELEENVKRLDLTWQERVQATSQIHQLFLSLDEGWTQEQTAEQLALADHTTVSKYLRVAQVLDDERISGCKTFNEALNVLQRRQDRQAGSALDALLDSPALLAETPTATPFIVGSSPATSTSSQLIPVPTPTPIPPIICANFAEWVAAYSGPKFNLVHCDFPYGIKMFSGPQSRGSGASAAGAPAGLQANPEDLQFYADDPEIFANLTETLCKNLDRIMSTSGHLMFWYSERHRNWLLDTFRTLAPGLIFQTFPLIWHKTDNAGIASDPSRGPRHIYETCLLASRGDRKIVRVVGDVYGCPTDKRIHPSCKPEPMLRHFMSMLVDEHSRVFDPTAGSGSALAAAEALGASAILGLEIDQGVTDLANQAIRQGRAKRQGAI